MPCTARCTIGVLLPAGCAIQTVADDSGARNDSAALTVSGFASGTSFRAAPTSLRSGAPCRKSTGRCIAKLTSFALKPSASWCGSAASVSGFGPPAPPSSILPMLVASGPTASVIMLSWANIQPSRLSPA